jgi:DNA-binding transcriptional ArsR family regulator
MTPLSSKMVKENHTGNSQSTLPAHLRIVPAATVRRDWGISESTLWRAERDGRLRALRIGRRKYYRQSDLEAFLDAASRAEPISVPWTETIKS